MPLPAGVETVTVSSGQPLTLPDGSPIQGKILFSGPDVVTIDGRDVVLGGTVEAVLDGGEFSVTLVAIDATGMTPSGWTYTVTAVLSNAPPWTRYVSLPKAVPAVVLADVIVADPVAGVSATLFPVSGTPAPGQVPTAISSTAASWQTPAGSLASSSVTGETGYGQSAAAGSASSYSRGDHTHGTPALASSAPAVTEGIGAAAAVGTANLPARADHVHPMAAAGAPHASAVGDAAVTGTATTFASSDHVHAREAFGAVTALSAFGASSANGTAVTVARSDHVHGAPTLPTASTSTAGIVQLDGTAGDIQALGGQAAGSVGRAADAGHVHPTTGLVLTATDQSIDGIKTYTSIPVLPASDPASGNQATRRVWVDEQSGWGLGDYQDAGAGIKAWSGQPGYSASAALTFGRIQMLKLWVRAAATLTTVNLFVTTAGSGLTSAQNFVALYDASGTQVGISADQTTAFGTTGLKAVAITTPYSAAVGGYYVAILTNGTTTAPSIAVHGNSGGSALLNFGLSLSAGRALQTGTGNTSMPSSITLGLQSFSSMNFCAVIT